MEFGRMSEEELLQSVADDNSEAAAEIYRRYYSLVHRYCRTYMRGHDEHDIHEVTQLVFVNLLVNKKILTFRGDALFTTWLHTVARNLCFTWIKRERREPGSLLENSQLAHAERYVSRRTESILQSLEGAEQRRFLEQAVESLEEEYQVVLVLRFYLNKSYQESAEILGITASYFGVRLKRAVEKLRKNMRRMERKRHGRKPALPKQHRSDQDHASE